MCLILGTLPEAIRSYWEFSTIVIKNITSHQSYLYLVMKRISIRKGRHVNTLVEVVMTVEGKKNARITGASRNATRTNLTEGTIRETVIILESVFKREEISGCVLQ